MRLLEHCRADDVRLDYCPLVIPRRAGPLPKGGGLFLRNSLLQKVNFDLAWSLSTRQMASRPVMAPPWRVFAFGRDRAVYVPASHAK